MISGNRTEEPIGPGASARFATIGKPGDPLCCNGDAQARQEHRCVHFRWSDRQACQADADNALPPDAARVSLIASRMLE